MLLHLFPGAVHVITDARVALEVGLDIGLRLALRNAELGRQTKGAHAIDDAEVDGFRRAAHHRVHAFDRRVEHRSEEHTSELQSLMRSSYAVFCLTKKKNKCTIHLPT